MLTLDHEPATCLRAFVDRIYFEKWKYAENILQAMNFLASHYSWQMGMKIFFALILLMPKCSYPGPRHTRYLYCITFRILQSLTSEIVDFREKCQDRASTNIFGKNTREVKGQPLDITLWKWKHSSPVTWKPECQNAVHVLLDRKFETCAK